MSEGYSAYRAELERGPIRRRTLDRFGNPIMLGWPEHHLLWLAAAWSLPAAERNAALREISELTGRSAAACYFRAHRQAQYVARHERRAALVAFAQAHAGVS